MQAVILAAGQGIRIRHHHELPKGLIQLGDKPIIVQSIEKLMAHGVQDILLVVGFGSHYYEELVQTLPNVALIYNAAFATTSSLRSLYCAKEWIKEDTLILESDLFFEARAIKEIMATPHTAAILVSGKTASGDEVFVSANNNYLIDMSKDATELAAQTIIGEFVGINKLSLQDYRALVTLLEKEPALLNAGHYEEDGLVRLTQLRPVFCEKIEKLLWCEIDTVEHLARAKQLYAKESRV